VGAAEAANAGGGTDAREAAVDVKQLKALVTVAEVGSVTRATNSMRVQKRLVLAGHGWTVLPGVGIAEDVSVGTLSAAPLSEPDVWRSIVLGMPRTGRTPPAVEVVARELNRQVRTAVHEGRWPAAQLHAQGVATEGE
jgi:DNA-binding transcriptional LysR family regulator